MPSYACVIDGGTFLQVPTIVCYEVFRRIANLSDQRVAATYVEMLKHRDLVSLDLPLAVLAAQLSTLHKLHMADAVIYATAQSLGVELWTHDTHFQGLPGVRFVTP